MKEIVADRKASAAKITMSRQIEIREADNPFRDAIVGLLQSENLPVEALSQPLHNFFVALCDGIVIGAVGLEKYDDCGLLRSLVVDPSYRNQQLAGRLINALEKKAVMLGIDCIYLFTETAPLYFERKHYSRISRSEVPLPLERSSEFSHICSISAIVMKKMIA